MNIEHIKLLKDLFPALTTILVSLLTGAFGVYLFQRAKIKDIESQLSEKKYDAYNTFISLVYDIMKRIRFKEAALTSDEIYLKLLPIKKDLIIYANDSVVQAFFNWEHKAREGKSDLKYLFIVIAEMRKDMGKRGSRINYKLLLYNLIYNPSEKTSDIK